MAALLLLRLLGPRATLRRGIKSVPRSSPAASVNSKTTRRRPTKLKGLVGVMCQFQLVSSLWHYLYSPPTYSTTTLPFLETSCFSPAYAYQHSSVPPHPLVLLTLLSHHLFCPVPLLSSPSLSSPSCPPLPHALLSLMPIMSSSTSSDCTLLTIITCRILLFGTPQKLTCMCVGVCVNVQFIHRIATTYVLFLYEWQYHSWRLARWFVDNC